MAAAERRARLAVRHHVAPATRVTDPADAARGLVCYHATDPATVYLSAWARLRSPSIDLIDQALYEDRTLVRMLAMRRTMFVVPVEDAPVLQSAAANGLVRRERGRNRELAERLDVPDADVAVVVGGALGEREHVQRVGRLLRPSEGKRAVVYELVTRNTIEVGQARRRRQGLVVRRSAQL